MAVAFVVLVLGALTYLTRSWDRRAAERAAALRAIMQSDRQEMLRIARASLSLVGLSAIDTADPEIKDTLTAEWTRSRAALEAASRRPDEPVDIAKEAKLLRELFDGDVVFEGSPSGTVTPESAAWLRQYIRLRVMTRPEGGDLAGLWNGAQLEMRGGAGGEPDEGADSETSAVYVEWERRLEAVTRAAPSAGVALLRLPGREVCRLRGV